MNKILTILLFCLITSVSAQQLRIINPVRILALGDSYTIGQGVPESERFPAQLADSLSEKGFSIDTIVYRARTGWTTSSLLTSLDNDSPSMNYTLVTLLMGVNNQFNMQNIVEYAEDFDQLIQLGLSYVRGSQTRLVILSIPDYGFTPFGQNRPNVSEEIDEFNAVNDSLATRYGIPYVNITDISRRGLDEPELIASDNLHPSKLMYAEWVERILEISDLDFIVTGLEDQIENEVNIYPNPFNNEITFDSKGKTTLVLYSVTGQVMHKNEFANSYKVDLRNLSAGVYFCDFNQSGVSRREILIKK